MSTLEVANRLVELCRQGKWEQAQQELYDNNAISIEPAGAPVEKTVGLDAIIAKGDQWVSMVKEVHHFEISDPVVAGNYFAVSMKNDITFHEMGRMEMEEVCVYQVGKGKITKEQFFFQPMSNEFADKTPTGMGDDDDEGFTDKTPTGMGDDDDEGFTDKTPTGMGDDDDEGFTDKTPTGMGDDDDEGFTDKTPTGMGDDDDEGFTDKTPPGMGDDDDEGFVDKSPPGMGDDDDEG